MTRDHYIIVRLDYVVVPTSVAYVAHCDTPYDLNLRFTYFRESATYYSNKREAIREAKRIKASMSRYAFNVVGRFSQRIVFSTLSA